MIVVMIKIYSSEHTTAKTTAVKSMMVKIHDGYMIGLNDGDDNRE